MRLGRQGFPGKILLGLFCSLMIPAFLTAEARERSQAVVGSVEGLQRWLAGTQDLQGQFEQDMVSGALGSALSEAGTFQMQRPGRIRWDYTDPERKVAIVDHDLTMLYVEEDEQMILGRLDESSNLLPRLLAGEEPIESIFIVEEADKAEIDQIDRKRQARVVLRPRAGGDSVSRILLTLGLPEHSIQSADVLDSAGNRQEFRFLDLRRNTGLAGSPFEFEPPEGTEILGGS